MNDDRHGARSEAIQGRWQRLSIAACLSALAMKRSVAVQIIGEPV